MYYIYALECKNKIKKIIYVGYTDNLKERVKKHQSNSVNTTKFFDKTKLIYYEACLDKRDAQKREKALKTGFGRGYLKKRLRNYLKEAPIAQWIEQLPSKE